MTEQLEFSWEGKTESPTPSEHLAPEILQDLADAMRNRLSERSGYHIHLRINNNSSTMMSVRYDMARRIVRLNVHRFFLDAPDQVHTALALWIKSPKSKRAAAVLNPYIASQQHRVKERAPRKVQQSTEGHHHNLLELFNEVNTQEFMNEVQCPITWGRMPTRRRRRSIRFGSYTPIEHLIRIHPYLDQAHVPRYFVKYIVFHEMLHAYMGIEESASGRRQIHPPAFKKREAAYPDFQQALDWMNNERNLRRLLRTPPDALRG